MLWLVLILRLNRANDFDTLRSLLLFLFFAYLYYDLSVKSPNPRHASIAVGERLYERKPYPLKQAGNHTVFYIDAFRRGFFRKPRHGHNRTGYRYNKTCSGRNINLTDIYSKVLGAA